MYSVYKIDKNSANGLTVGSNYTINTYLKVSILAVVVG